PGDTKPGIKQAESAASFGRRDQVCDDCVDQRSLRSHAKPPQNHTNKRKRRVSEKNQWSKKSCNKENPEHDDQPEFVEQLAEIETSERTRGHGHGVVDRDQILRHGSCFFKMVTDQGEIGQASSDTCVGRKVP